LYVVDPTEDNISGLREIARTTKWPAEYRGLRDAAEAILLKGMS